MDNSTIEMINYLKDVEFEYNIKLMLLGLLLLYSIAAFWLASKWETEKYYAKIIKIYLFKIPFGVILFFYPLLTLFLLRAVSYETFYMLMITFYGYALVVLLIAGKLGIFELVMDMLGIKPKAQKIEAKYQP